MSSNLIGPTGGIDIMAATRIRGNWLYTPVVRYRHQTNGQFITLIGNIHVGPAEYYARLNQIIAAEEYDGATIQYEGVKAGDSSSLTSNQIEAVETMVRLMQAFREVAIDAGLSHLSDELPFSNTWVNTDITMPEIIARMDKRSIEMLRGLGKDIRKLSHNQLKKFLTISLRFIIVLGPLLALAKVLGRKTALDDTVILNDRNEVALKAAIDHLDTNSNDLVMIWGSAHLKGIGAGLEVAGCVYDITKWIPVIQLTKLARLKSATPHSAQHQAVP